MQPATIAAKQSLKAERGRPGFYKPLVAKNVEVSKDNDFGMTNIKDPEVKKLSEQIIKSQEDEIV